MDPMSGSDIRFLFTLKPRSTLQYEKCIHLWNNYIYILSLWTVRYTQYSVHVSAKRMVKSEWIPVELMIFYYLFSRVSKIIEIILK